MLPSLIFAVASSLLPAVALAVPLTADQGITFSSGNDKMPVLTLPYAKYKAYSYNATRDYYTFKNIRFAAPPIGQLRWKKPIPPVHEKGVQDGKTGYQCMQAFTSSTTAEDKALENLEPSSEDCLFLDIMVPGKAARGQVKGLPVLFWLFGGGYVFGSKSYYLYDGGPLLKSADNDMIYVAANYRLGAFGFLAGPTVEKNAVANVGLHDQLAALQWVQNYIHALGGDKNKVTAMGESAGAGSIMHHLVANGGTLKPLFQQAIMMSPAFESMYVPEKLENTYKHFAESAGCKDFDIACLRTKTEQELDQANQAVVLSAPPRFFGWGPAVDHTYIRDLPAIEMRKGNYWRKAAILVGHTSDEGSIFVDPTITTSEQVNSLFDDTFPSVNQTIRDQLVSYYPPAPVPGRYTTEFDRVSNLVGEWAISCNARYLAQAYNGMTYSYQYSIPPGLHAQDLALAFWRPELNFPTLEPYAIVYQSYLTSFVRSGNPNTYREKGTTPKSIEFPKTKVGENIKVLDINLPGFSEITDKHVPKDRCGWWQSGVWTGRATS